MDLLDLLLFYTKSQADMLMTVKLVLEEWFLVRNLELKVMHIDSSFIEPNIWIIDMENCWWHTLHLAIDRQSQWHSLIPGAQPCNNCLW
jgi:hypothetical protein